MKALFSAFYWVVLQPRSAGTDTCLLLRIPIQFYRIDIREGANTHKVISYKYLSNRICTVVEEFCQSDFSLWRIFFLDVLLPRVIDGSEGGAAFGVGFRARSPLSCRKLHLSPFEHWPYSLHWQHTPFPLSNANEPLSTLDHCSCFDFPVSGVKVLQSEFLISTSFHHRLQFLIIGHRYLSMNFHVVQFSYGFELIRLTYSQFVQTFQDIIGWYF